MKTNICHCCKGSGRLPYREVSATYVVFPSTLSTNEVWENYKMPSNCKNLAEDKGRQVYLTMLEYLDDVRKLDSEVRKDNIIALTERLKDGSR